MKRLQELAFCAYDVFCNPIIILLAEDNSTLYYNSAFAQHFGSINLHTEFSLNSILCTQSNIESFKSFVKSTDTHITLQTNNRSLFATNIILSKFLLESSNYQTPKLSIIINLITAQTIQGSLPPTLMKSKHEYILLDSSLQPIHRNNASLINPSSLDILKTKENLCELIKSQDHNVLCGYFVINKQLIEYQEENTKKWIEISVRILKNNNNNSISFLLKGRDRTEFHETKNQLEVITKQIQTTSDFISNLAHEIRNSLNGIIGMLQFLSYSELSTEQLSCITAATNSSHALSHLLNDVLDLSKIQAGELNVSIVPTSVWKIVSLMEDLAQIYSNQVVRKGVSLFIDYPMDGAFSEVNNHRRNSLGIPPTLLRRSSSETDLKQEIVERAPTYLHTDIMRIRQILVNLISNAVKYTHEGFIRVKLSLFQLDTPNSFNQQFPIQIEISDSGEGISNDNLRNVFSRFKRFVGTSAPEGVTRPEGTGIGLSIAKALSQKLGGQIILDSEVGKGSTFTLCLPVNHDTHMKVNRRISIPLLGITLPAFPDDHVDTQTQSGTAPLMSEIKHAILRRTIVVISKSGPQLLGSGCMQFLSTDMHCSVFFYNSLEQFSSAESVNKSNPTKEKTFETLCTLFEKENYCENLTIDCKDPWNADIVVMDTSTFYAEKKSVLPETEEFCHSMVPNEFTGEQREWLEIIRNHVQKVEKIISHGDTIEAPANNIPYTQHPRTNASLFLVLPPTRVHMLNHLRESGVKWYSGWFPLPFIPSRFFHGIFEQMEQKSAVSPPMEVLPPLITTPRRQYRVLLVDDNSVNRKVAQKLIVRVRPDVQLDFGCDGSEAVAKFEKSVQRNEPYDLCLMDLRMPLLDGAGATRQIRLIEEAYYGSRVYIVALTASIISTVEDECYSAGMNDILCKPLVASALEEMLERYIPSDVIYNT